jgi:hypothetical protein
MRKTLNYTVPGVRSETIGERDNGKTFVLTEMPADQAERWALRLLFAMQAAGVEIPEDAQDAGIAALAAVGLKAVTAIRFAEAEPLLAEMMACVRYQHAPNQQPQELMTGAASQIEDVKTRLLLRAKVFELHTGFSLPVVPPTSG